MVADLHCPEKKASFRKLRERLVPELEMRQRQKARGTFVKGKCKWWNKEKGYGFLSAAGKDVFVHYSMIQVSGRKDLVEGEAVEFDIEQAEKGPRAINVIKVGEL